MKRTLALMAMMAGLTGSLALSNAQEPKTKPKADDKKPAAKAADKKAPGTIVYYEGKKGWRFRIEGADEKTLAMCVKNYEKKEDVLKEIEAVKAILNSEKPVEGKAKD